MPNKSDEHLRGAAEEFLCAFDGATANSAEEAKRIVATGRFGFASGVVYEFTEQLATQLGRLASRAATLLGAKVANESAIQKIALKFARDTIGTGSPKSRVTPLIDAVFAGQHFDFLLPNHLIRLADGLQAVKIGPVTITFTNDAKSDVEAKAGGKIQVLPGADFSVSLQTDPFVALTTMPPVAWLVSLDAAIENLEEEVKWLIDVAVGLLRFQYLTTPSLFPRIGDFEPQPFLLPLSDHIGIKIASSGPLVGGITAPRRYEIDDAMRSKLAGQEFQEKAMLIFEPPPKTLAQRVAQGLGWLTRGRQARDRSERLLNFFTAIESVLTSEDKNDPVTQTISRHAAVLLTNSVPDRIKLSADIRKLYAIRSDVVHAGKREVIWTTANTTQLLAETILMNVLEKADLGASYASFCKQLADASFGGDWPPNAPTPP